VIRGHADVCVTRLDDLKHALQNANDRAVRAVDAFVEAAKSVEVTEQLVRSVDKVNDQFASLPVSSQRLL
jgi:hypothetical protein